MTDLTMKNTGLDAIPYASKPICQRMVLNQLNNCPKNIKLAERQYEICKEEKQKEINKTGSYNNLDKDYLFRINGLEKNVQESHREFIFQTKFYERLKMIDQIIELDMDDSLDRSKKHQLKEELYQELSKILMEEALECLECDINITRLDKHIILPYKNSDRTSSVNKKLDELTDKISELRRKFENIKKLYENDKTGEIKQIDFHVLTENKGTDIVNIMFQEELYTEKKRTA